MDKQVRLKLLGQEIRQFKDWKKISYVSQNGMASCQNFPASVEEFVQAGLYTQIGKFRFAGKGRGTGSPCAASSRYGRFCKTADWPTVRRAATEGPAGKGAGKRPSVFAAG